jgi:hypothetical protein
MDTTLEEPINETTELAFAKAGQPDASEEVRKKWLVEMKEAGVAVMKFSSSRLAKVIKGELAVAELRK